MSKISVVNKLSAHFDCAQCKQKGALSPVLIIGGIVVLVIIFFVATGSFKFNVSTNQQPSQKEDQTTESAASSEPKSYQSDQYGFNLKYPADWSYKEAEGQYVAAFLSPEESSSDPYREFVGIKVVNLSSQPGISLQGATDLWEKQTIDESADDNFQVVKRKSSIVSGEEARDIVYTANIDNLAIKGFVRIVLKNNNAYIFQYFAEADKYDKYLPDIESILSSVSL